MEEKKKTHKERVLDYLTSRGPMKHGATICEINEKLRIGDARERIRDLRNEGHTIETRYTDENGERHSWGRYFYHFPTMTREEALRFLDDIGGLFTKQQYKTIKGQILAGEIDGALAGMRTRIRRAGK